MTQDEIVAAMSKAGEKGADRPGRAFKRAGTNLRSAVEDTDWHDLKEHRFLHPAAGAMERLIRERETKALVVVAPRALADQRSTFHTEVKTCIIAEIDKDLTHHPVGEIEKHLVG